MNGKVLFEDDIVMIYEKLPGEDSEKLVGSPVGRLDKPVGGLMLLAKDKSRVQSLSDSYDKQYLAVVSGHFEGDDVRGTMKDLLLHDRRKNKSFPVKRMRNGVRDAELIYEQVAYNAEKDLSLVTVCPITGRTHQIRVQFASRKHPLFGDGKYGSRHKGAIGLYAARLFFEHPVTGEEMDLGHEPFESSPWDLFSEEEIRQAVDLSLRP